jgi:hypothetical protein
MGGTCGMHGRDLQGTGRKTRQKKSTGGPTRRWDDIKKDLKDTGWEGVDLIHQSQKVQWRAVANARFQVMTAFWDTVPYSLVQLGRRFRGAYCLQNWGDESC